MSKSRTQKLRNQVEKDFRPLFQEREVEGGIPMVELRSHLKKSHLPQNRINKFLHEADANRDAVISYNEFYDQIMHTDEATLQRLSMPKRVMNRAVQVVAPDRINNIRMEAYDAADYMNWGEAKVEDYTEAYDCKPPPFMIPLITVAEIAVFIYYAVLLNTDKDKTNDVTARSGVTLNSPLPYSPYRRIEAWRFITYMFMHSGYIHLIFNCIIQLILGTLLEVVHKFWRVAIVYLLGVLAGSLAHSVFDPNIYLVGASGGCYALMGAHLATVIINWGTMQKNWCKSPVNFLSSGVFRLIMILLLAGADTGLAIYDRFNSQIPSKIGYSAHLGGAVAGILVGIPVLRNLEVTKFEKICFWISIVLYSGFMIAGIVFNVVCGSRNLCKKIDLTQL